MPRMPDPVPESERGDWHPYAACPHCGAVDWDSTDYPDGLDADGDTAQWECSRCERPFRVTLAVTYEFRTAAIPEVPRAAR